MNDQEILNRIKKIEKKLVALKAANQKKAVKSKLVAKKQIIVAKKPKVEAKSRVDETVKTKEAQRVKNVAKLVATLTKNLPEKPEISPNQTYYILRNQMVEKAFISALENNVVFTAPNEYRLIAIKDSEEFEVKASDLEPQVDILVEWSKIPPHKLTDDKGKKFDHYAFYHLLHLEAVHFKTKQDRLKTSDEHLAEIVEAMACEEFKHDTTANRTKVLEKFTAHLVSTNKKLGKQFYKDISGNLYINCSDQKFGMTKLDPKKVKSSFQKIIENSEVAGKLKSSKDAETLLEGFTKHQKRH